MTPDSGLRRTSESLPHTTEPVVIKIGGRSLEAPGAPEELAAEVASLSDDVLLVHGGGREVSDWCERFEIEPRFVDGLRVTDPATLEVAVAVLAGLANKRLVALLRASNVGAVGLSLADGVAEVAPHADAASLGAVGRVAKVDSGFLETLLASAHTPVLASVGAMGGALVNVNADDAAAAIAAAMGARALVLLSDTAGVQLGGAVTETIEMSELDRVIARDDVQGGMVAKLRAARAALEGGVACVRIGAWQGPGTLAALLESGNGGTTIHRADDRAPRAVAR